jgi:mRNA-degrading endonuclease YafQ of YafQ-DinJ toxin-antitoxin module
VSKYNFSFHNKFLRKLKKLYKKDKFLYERVKTFLENLAEDPFYPGFKTHRIVVTDYGKVYSSRVTGDIRVIWNLENGCTILLLDIGGHEGSKKVYK